MKRALAGGVSMEEQSRLEAECRVCAGRCGDRPDRVCALRADAEGDRNCGG